MSESGDTFSSLNISQFLTFTGSADPVTATSYLQRCDGNVDAAVGMFLDQAEGDNGDRCGGEAQTPNKTETISESYFTSTTKSDLIVLENTLILNSDRAAADLKIQALRRLSEITSDMIENERKQTASINSIFTSVINVMNKYKGEEELLEHYHSDLQFAGAQLLAKITFYQRKWQLIVGYKDMEIIWGVMFMSMKYDSKRTELFESFLDVILNLSYINRDPIIHAGYVSPVVDIMNEHYMIEPIQEKGCSILAIISSTLPKDPHGHVIMIELLDETNGIEMVVSALRDFTKNERIQVNACKFLAQLSAAEEARVIISDHDGIVYIEKAINAYSDNPSLLKEAFSALSNLLSCFDSENRSNAFDIYQAVCKCLRNHSDDQGLQDECQNILRKLSPLMVNENNSSNTNEDVEGVPAEISTNFRMKGIPETQHRGITVSQLRHIRDEIGRRCIAENWTCTDPRRGTGIRLQPNTVTLYDLVEHYIKPITQERKCSYVEAITDHQQTPKWFVSHWWGEPVVDFVKCIERHAFDRGLPDDTPYWVCAYAMNQHEIESEMTSNPMDSKFLKAMRLTEGTVSVLDRESVCYTRIWCSFEISFAIRHFEEERAISKRSRYLFDVYTLAENGNDRKAVGLTDGIVYSDQYKYRFRQSPYKKYAWNPNRFKRQSDFPLETCRRALHIRLEEANASYEKDKRRILNCISGTTRSIDEEPPASHDAYDETNALLRGKFASAAYRRALEQQEDMTQYRVALSAAPLRHLQSSFSRCDQFRLEGLHFSESLPTTLEALELEYDAVSFVSSEEFAIGFSRLNNLRSLKLRCDFCNRLSSLHTLWVSISALIKLTELELNFKQNTQVSSICGLGEALATFTELEKLALNFSGCSGICSVYEITRVMPSLGNLKALHLNFRMCRISEHHQIWESISGLPLLQELHLEFYDKRLTSIDGLVDSILPLRELKVLNLNFSECKAISSSVRTFAEALVRRRTTTNNQQRVKYFKRKNKQKKQMFLSLSTVHLNFENCQLSAESKSALCWALTSYAPFTDLKLNLMERNDLAKAELEMLRKVRDVEGLTEFCQGFVNKKFGSDIYFDSGSSNIFFWGIARRIDSLEDLLNISYEPMSLPRMPLLERVEAMEGSPHIGSTRTSGSLTARVEIMERLLDELKKRIERLESLVCSSGTESECGTLPERVKELESTPYFKSQTMVHSRPLSERVKSMEHSLCV